MLQLTFSKRAAIYTFFIYYCVRGCGVGTIDDDNFTPLSLLARHTVWRLKGCGAALWHAKVRGQGSMLEMYALC